MTTTPTAPTTRDQHRTEVEALTARDGRLLTLLHVRGPQEPHRGPVLLVHGAGMRAELFRPPLPHTLVDALLTAGWDVWMLNWRASIDLEPTDWTLCDAAVLDHPAAVDHVLARTGARTLAAIVHCQGSTSFMMAAAAGLLPGVDRIVSNSVSLHPVLPAFAEFKFRFATPVFARRTPYLSPAWAYRSDGRSFSRILRRAVGLTHPECRNLVCKMASFTYGSGRPALWSHGNLDVATHEWLTGEFAEVPMTYFAQMSRCVEAGHLRPVRHTDVVPDDLGVARPRSDARIALLTGQDNRCFLPESQRRTFAHLERTRPGRQSLHILPGYGHLDVFWGRTASRDVFPIILQELDS